jgi:PAS domain S-box-containing protein
VSPPTAKPVVTKPHPEHVRKLIDSGLVGYFVGDDSHRLTECNDAFLALIGRTRADAESGRIFWPDHTPADYADISVQARIDRSRGIYNAHEIQFAHSNGERRWVKVLGMPLGNGKHGLIVIDITARKTAEAAYIAAQKHTESLLATLALLQASNLTTGIDVPDEAAAPTLNRPSSRLET